MDHTCPTKDKTAWYHISITFFFFFPSTSSCFNLKFIWNFERLLYKKGDSLGLSPASFIMTNDTVFAVVFTFCSLSLKSILISRLITESARRRWCWYVGYLFELSLGTFCTFVVALLQTLDSFYRCVQSGCYHERKTGLLQICTTLWLTLFLISRIDVKHILEDRRLRISKGMIYLFPSRKLTVFLHVLAFLSVFADLSHSYPDDPTNGPPHFVPSLSHLSHSPILHIVPSTLDSLLRRLLIVT